MEHGTISPAVWKSALRTVFISGSNRGIGLGLVRYYLNSGDRVIAALRTSGKEEALRPLQAEYGDRLSTVGLDVTNECSITGMAASLPGAGLDLVINNAGISVEQSFGRWSAPGFETNLRVNAIGPALVAQALVPLMKPGAKLINMSSGMGSITLNINPENGLDGYAMSKAALNMLTRRIAAKLETHPITVIAIDPGWVRTDMGGDEAPTSVEDSVTAMTQFIDSLTPAESGKFYSAHGKEIPW